MDVWKVREMDQKGHNAELKGKWEEEVKKWGIERDNAKTDHRKPRWTKPKMPSMEKALRKPLLADFAVQDSESDEDDENDGDADPLMSDDSGWRDQEPSWLGKSRFWCDWSIDLVSADNNFIHWFLHCTVQHNPIITFRYPIDSLL